LVVAAMCGLYLVSSYGLYLAAAKDADYFIQKYLCEGDTLYVSFHMGKRGVLGFLDDYASYIFAQISLYRVTLEREYLDRAVSLCDTVISDFGDERGGFYLYGNRHEKLILRPKESYDGAIPSGNSLMAYNLVRLSLLTDEENFETIAQKQIEFLKQSASRYPTSHAMFLMALLEQNSTSVKITVVSAEQTDKSALALDLPQNANIIFLTEPTKAYSLKNGKTTFYVCRGHSCLPPTNDLNELKI